MLKNFNNYIKNIILEQVTEDKDEKYIKLVYHCNEFYVRYLSPLADEYNVSITKQRNNVFLAFGTFENIIKAFNNLKVDEMFMEKPADFVIVAPMYCFNDAEYEHKMQRGELYAPAFISAGVPTPTTHDVDNVARNVVFGRWFDFYQNEKKGQKLLTITPSKFKKYIKEVQKKYDLTDNDNIFIEFSVNCEDWKNNIFEDMAEYRTEDEINEINSNKEKEIDFDYDLAKMPKENNEDHRKALKDIKVTKKTYKENKIK